MRTTESSKSRGKKWSITHTPRFYVEQLGRELYADKSACFWEGVKNAANAHMSNGKWEPEKTRIEIALVKNHPLAQRSTALVLMDAGRGFTEDSIKYFCQIGPDVHDKSSHGGTSEKRMGKLAMFALNGQTLSDYDTGFWLMTRTSSTGPVTLLEITPNHFANDTLEEKIIGPDATELGAYRNFRGSFSIFVIPNSVFHDDRELRHGLMWKIPRLHNKALNIKINGKPLEAPPLSSKMREAGTITAYLDKLKEAEVGNEERSGIWLTDADTGIRCAYAPAMQGVKGGLPYPLGWPGLTGDIMIPGLASQQRTDRQGLKPSFIRESNRVWRDILDRLRLHISPFAQQLLGNQDLMRDSDPQVQILHDLAEEFASVFGPGDIASEDVIAGTEVEETPGKPTKDKDKPKGPPIHPRDPGPGGDPGKGRGRRRTRGFKIGGKDYYFAVLPQPDQEIFAEISRNSNAICINPNYGIKRKTASAQREHMLLKICETVAHHHERDLDAARRLMTRFLMQHATGK